MDDENNGKPYFLMDDLGKTHYFRKHPYLPTSTNATLDILNRWLSWLLCRLPHTPLQTTGCVVTRPKSTAKRRFLAVSECLSFGLGLVEMFFQTAVGFWCADAFRWSLENPGSQRTVLKMVVPFGLMINDHYLKNGDSETNPEKTVVGWWLDYIHWIIAAIAVKFWILWGITIGSCRLSLYPRKVPPKKTPASKTRLGKKHARALLMSHDM